MDLDVILLLPIICEFKLTRTNNKISRAEGNEHPEAGITLSHFKKIKSEKLKKMNRKIERLTVNLL